MNVKITLGADPEFTLIQGRDNVVMADDLFEDTPGYYTDRWGNEVERTGHDPKDPYMARIGKDGAGDAVELRPHPAKNSKWLMYNTRRLMKKFKKVYGKDSYKLSVCGDEVGVGAHFHFGIALDGKTFHGWSPTKTLLYMFDDAIGEYLMSRSGSARGSYAELSAGRTNDHGFEYRTPSAIAFAKPEYVELISRIFHHIIQYYFKNKSRVEKLDRETVRSLALRLKNRLLTKKDRKVIADLEKYKPKHRDNILKYWCK